MMCPGCLDDNNKLIKEKGYGRSYIPGFMDCKKHNNDIAKSTPLLFNAHYSKNDNKQPFDKNMYMLLPRN